VLSKINRDEGARGGEAFRRKALKATNDLYGRGWGRDRAGKETYLKKIGRETFVLISRNPGLKSQVYSSRIIWG